MKRKTFVFIFIFLFCVPVLFTSDTQIETTTKAALKSLNINIESVKIADGRRKGGERARWFVSWKK